MILELIVIGFCAGCAAAVESHILVPLSARCPDASIPVNSLSHRCHQGTEQLHWTGRKCDNSTYQCPEHYSCTAAGLCCTLTPVSGLETSGQLCLLDPNSSTIIHVLHSCTTHADCAKHRSIFHRCCAGKCVIYAPRCHYTLIDFLLLRSTGAHTGQFIPICNAEGGYERVQSDSRLGISWCVNVRTGLSDVRNCCLASAKPQVCPGDSSSSSSSSSRILSCPSDMCSMEVCLGHPDSVCRVNPCGSECRVEFFDRTTGQRVDCFSGLGRCGRRRQQFYTKLARLHRRDQTLRQQQQHFRVANGRQEDLQYHLEDCQQQQCVHYDADLLERPDSSSSSSSNNTGHCNLPIDSGRCPSDAGCQRMCKRWGFDRRASRCRGFWYAGSGGVDDNRFNSWSQCMWAAQVCHRRVLIALPTLPACRADNDDVFAERQWSDNGFYWCSDGNGNPTSGSLHAADILCRSNGSLLRDWYYEENEAKFAAACPDGRQPQWCHNVDVDASCRTPGVSTFADACDECRLVRVNADGDEIRCHTEAEICGSSVDACKSVTPRYTYNQELARCQPAPTGRHVCNSSNHVANYNFFSREDYCQHACSPSWCPNQPAHLRGRVFPDLCVRPDNCPDVPAAVCVADDCRGVERYLLPETGEEMLHCRRQMSPLDLEAAAACATATAATPATKATAEASTTTEASTTRRQIGVCRLKDELRLQPRDVVCNDEDGKYRSFQCNGTHCWCVVADSGDRILDWPPVPAAAVDCPSVETMSINMSLSFAADFDALLSSSSARAEFESSAGEQLRQAALLMPKNVAAVTASRGSVLLLLQLRKLPGDTADLPAAVFELETKAIKGTLELRYKDSVLVPTARQRFATRAEDNRNAVPPPRQQQQQQQQQQLRRRDIKFVF